LDTIRRYHRCSWAQIAHFQRCRANTFFIRARAFQISEGIFISKLCFCCHPLRPDDFIHLSLASKEFHQKLDTEVYWEQICRAHYSSIEFPQSAIESEGWKNLHRTLAHGRKIFPKKTFMGKFLYYFMKPKIRRLLVVGLPESGKTTLLYQLKFQSNIIAPSIGFQVESLEYKDFVFTVCSIPMAEKIKPLMAHYLTGIEALVFVVDSCDLPSMEIAAEELVKFIAFTEEQGNTNLCLLCLANKGDLPNAIRPEEISLRLKLYNLKGPWFVQPCCMITGDGVFEGFDTLQKMLE